MGAWKEDWVTRHSGTARAEAQFWDEVVVE